MGKIKYIDSIRKFFDESAIVDIESLKKFIKKKDKRYVHTVINFLLKKKEINQITRGFYSKYDDPTLAVFCFKPSYLGVQDALSFHNLWEQETIPIIVTTRKVRQGIREVFGVNVMIKRINRKYFFGFEYYKEGDFYFPYSDIEKTFIDMVYFRQPLDKEVILEFKKRIDRKKLKDYLERYPDRFRIKAERVFRHA